MTGQMASMLFMFDVVDRAVETVKKEWATRETRTDFADIEVQRQEIQMATGIDPLHDLPALASHSLIRTASFGESKLRNEKERQA